MTPKDLRDIAAYYPNSNLTIKLLADLAEVDAPNFKLQLRPLASLTNEEIWACAKIGGYDGKGFIGRGIENISTATLTIHFDGRIYNHEHNEEHKINSSTAANLAGIYAYLQSIGIYVPGTIEEKYVDLIGLPVDMKDALMRECLEAGLSTEESEGLIALGSPLCQYPDISPFTTILSAYSKGRAKWKGTS